MKRQNGRDPASNPNFPTESGNLPFDNIRIKAGLLIVKRLRNYSRLIYLVKFFPLLFGQYLEHLIH